MDSEGWRPTGELRFVKRLVDAPEYGRYEDGTAKVSREARILQQRLKKQGILDTPSRYEWRDVPLEETPDTPPTEPTP